MNIEDALAKLSTDFCINCKTSNFNGIYRDDFHNHNALEIVHVHDFNNSTSIAKPEDFQFIKIVGQGNFGKVYLVQHRTDNKQYALKILDKKFIICKGEEKHVMNERNILIKNQKQPFVTSLYYSFQTHHKLFLAMEFVAGGELFYYIQHHRADIEKNADFYAAEIATALGYLHSKNIIYRDLKPENILLDSVGHIVITDFGLCSVGVSVTKRLTHSFCGTREYIAPEVIKKKKYDKAVDWWGLGAVLYEILCGMPPFYTSNIKKLYTSIVKAPLQIRTDLADSAKNILHKLLEKNPKYRLGSSERDVQDIQNHEFFRSINWEDLRNKKVNPPLQPLSILDNTEYNANLSSKSISKNLSTPSHSVRKENSSNEFSGFSYTSPETML